MSECKPTSPTLWNNIREKAWKNGRNFFVFSPDYTNFAGHRILDFKFIRLWERKLYWWFSMDGESENVERVT